MLMRFKKTDVQVQIRLIIRINNVLNADYDQVDKRWIDSYQEMWHFDDEIALALKLFTGEISPSRYPQKLKVNVSGLRDARRVFLTELRNEFAQGNVRISPRGSLYIGRITMQRKGGTPDPTKLQFKIKPCDLFKIVEGEINE